MADTPPPRGLQAGLIIFAIRFRGIVAALTLLLLAYGAYDLLRAKYDVFPEFAPPQVVVQTEAPGLSPEQVETLVTQPIENAINGAPGVRMLHSNSIQGLSVITTRFAPNSDIYRDRQVVAERLAVAGRELPGGVQPPVMAPLTSSMSTVLVIGLTSPAKSLMDMRTAADWVLRPRLLAVPGIANVQIFGGQVRSLQIQVHPDALIRYGIGLNDVLAAARMATGVRGAGFIDTRNQRVVFRTEGQAPDANALAGTVVESHGAGRVTLGDVARVVDAPAPAFGAASIMGVPGVVLVVSAQYGANTIEVTKRVEAALGELRPTLARGGIVLHDDIFRPADFIMTAVTNVRTSLLLGGAFVVAILFLFLFDLRTAAISCTAIPLSLLAAVVVLTHLGVTLNTMTLGGLAIAIGEVVDDAVIDVENIVRRLRENRRRAHPRPAPRVVLDASFEVRGAVVYATFMVILVFLPILALPGLAGRFFAPLGLAYILAIVASLAVALVVTPALAMLLLVRQQTRHDDPPLVRWTRGRYERLLTANVRRPKTVMVAAALFTLIGCSALPFFGGSFLPELKEGHFNLHMSAVPGTSLQESLRLGKMVTQALTALPEVRSVAQRVGRAELADDTWGTHYSELEVDLKPNLPPDVAEGARDHIRRALSGFVGVNFAVTPFLTERIEETLSGYTAAVVVNIFGNDLDALDNAAQQVARVLASVKGATSVQEQSPPGMPELSIRLRPRDLQRWGFDAVDVLDLVRAAYQGDVVGQTYDGNRVFNVITLLDRQSRNSVSKVGDLPLRAPDGAFVKLRQIADITEEAGRYQVLHQGAQRLQAVTADVDGPDVTTFVRQAKAAIAAHVHLPAGVYLQFAGAAEAQEQSQNALLLNGLIAGAGIILLLSVVTRHWRNLLLILVNLPFAMVGGVLAVFATGGILSLGSMVGFVTLFGITLRNSIMMISHYEHLVAYEGMRWGPDAAIRGAGDRLTPVLMTSLVTALGLLPLVIGMNDPGREIEGPMALVILGGLLTSMTLNLLVLPTLALRFGRFEPAADMFGAAVAPAE